MNKINTNISLDPYLKKESAKLFAKLGLDFSTAVSLFLKQAIIHNGLPFDVTLNDRLDEVYNEPNEETLAAFAEEMEMRNNPKKYKRYKNMEEFRKDIERELANE